jgi:hypothetical protein
MATLRCGMCLPSPTETGQCKRSVGCRDRDFSPMGARCFGLEAQGKLLSHCEREVTVVGQCQN